MAGWQCPNCQLNNRVEDELCRRCGSTKKSRALVVSESKPLLISSPQLPARPLKVVGASIAVGVVALIAEASILILHRRLQREDGSLLPVRNKRPLPAKTEVHIEEKKASGRRVVTVFSERVIEERRWGRPVRRIVDRLAWRSEESLES